MNHCLSFASEHHCIILGLAGILTIVSAMQLPNLRIVTDTRHLIPKDEIKEGD